MKIFIVSLAVFSVLSDWLDRHATDFDEGGLPPRKFILWGKVKALHPAYPDKSYFLLRLPAWQWGKDYARLRFCWTRLHVSWLQREGWQAHWAPEDDFA